jgi:hypothetical protein
MSNETSDAVTVVQRSFLTLRSIAEMTSGRVGWACVLAMFERGSDWHNPDI